MQIFRFKADRIPVIIFISLFALDIFVFFMASKLYAFIYMLFVLSPKVIICSWNHHHQHVKTFKQKYLNKILEVIFSFHTGAMPHMWVLHHNLGHHLTYQDQTKDQSRWKDKDGKIMGELRYSLEVMLTSFLRAYKVGKDYPKVQRYFVNMTFLVLLILLAMFVHNWFNALFIFLIPMIFSLFITSNATYNHHSGLDSDDPYKSSRNYTDKLYNLLSGNLGYHTAHHLKFGLHWSKLPDLHEKIKHKIPAELIIDPPYKKILDKSILLISRRKEIDI